MIQNLNPTLADPGSKLFLTIIGLPRSGTTILCNALNSFDNAFFLSEPLWNLHRRPDRISFGKLDGVLDENRLKREEFGSTQQYLYEFLQESGYRLGGLKETLRNFDSVDVTESITSHQFLYDDFIFIVRDPLFNFAGWKRKRFGEKYGKIGIFIENFQFLLQRILDRLSDGSLTIVKYELLDIDYLKSRLHHLFSFERLELRPTGFFFGDFPANSSRDFRAPNLDTSQLSESEIAALEPLREIYRALPDGKVTPIDISDELRRAISNF